jgi:hypothetical protein
VNVWENSKSKKNENTAKVHVHVKDAVHMVQLFDVTIYIYAGTVLERLPQNWVSRNMSRS